MHHPVVTDPDTGIVYVCTGWTGSGELFDTDPNTENIDPAPDSCDQNQNTCSGSGSSVTVNSLEQDSSIITWNFAEARSLTTEFDGLPEHLQRDNRFDPRGTGQGWNPAEPVWLVKDSTQTLTPPTEIYDEGGRVRYVLELAKALSEFPSVEGVDLFTRRITDKRVSSGYSREVEQLAEGVNEGGELMFVGHEPSMSEVVGDLIGGEVVMKKGGMARVDGTFFASPLEGELVWLIAPKVFDALGSG